jgi:hypothetical protein
MRGGDKNIGERGSHRDSEEVDYEEYRRGVSDDEDIRDSSNVEVDEIENKSESGCESDSDGRASTVAGDDRENTVAGDDRESTVTVI